MSCTLQMRTQGTERLNKLPKVKGSRALALQEAPAGLQQLVALFQGLHLGEQEGFGERAWLRPRGPRAAVEPPLGLPWEVAAHLLCVPIQGRHSARSNGFSNY